MPHGDRSASAQSPEVDQSVSAASLLVSRCDGDAAHAPDSPTSPTSGIPIHVHGEDDTDTAHDGNDTEPVSPESAVSASPPRAVPLCTSTPLHPHTQTDPHTDQLNGNNVAVAESLNSIDVLSGGESDAGDTINKNNWNTSISSGLATAARSRGRDLCDVAYFVVKELLMTERTYKADLETLTVGWSRSVSALAGRERAEAARPCLAVEDVVLAHGGLLARLERALLATQDSEEPEYKKVPELLHDHLKATYDMYMRYLSESGALVGRLEAVRRKERGVATAVSAHDSAHHISLMCAVLRPLHRIIYYQLYAQKLTSSLPGVWSSRVAALVGRMSGATRELLTHAQNHVTLCQLQRELSGYDKLLVAGREFLRLGCLYKHSNKGLQKRMIFLFSDIVVISSKSSGSQFRVTSVLPVRHIRVQDTELPHTFTINYEESSVMLSCSNEEEHVRWREEISRACLAAPDSEPDLSLDDAANDNVTECQNSGICGGITAVCWHRVVSVSRYHIHQAMTTQFSGYLLRKFKNSHGWQKLWVVFCVFTLYFYKTWHDQKPLASLPLLGYKMSVPGAEDQIRKEYVFKLQFKNHVYFFRADSQYTYDRWIESLQTASLQDKQNNNDETIK